MKLVVRGIVGGGQPNLRTYVPDDPEVFCEFLLVRIGTKHGNGADDFAIRVATPAGLAKLEERDGVLAQAPLLVLRRFDYDVLLSWAHKTVAACEAETWPDCVEKLRRYFHWEFENSSDVATLAQHRLDHPKR